MSLDGQVGVFDVIPPHISLAVRVSVSSIVPFRAIFSFFRVFFFHFLPKKMYKFLY